ncbi:lysis protein [Pseudomonas cavernicola]|uniref:Lysis protein n=1 Tax=Pseudomonas cavernicola TaxID=2320866 RepID=A0A418XF11_9PSED|nr:lysis protein [Pseudomonas cavernicola]RJG10928.1 lysis protein [Pseudomonas cavernicola]
MKAILSLVPIWLWALLGAAAIVGIQELRISWKESARIEAEAELDTSEAKAASLSATLKLSRELMTERDSLDTKYQQELTDARKDNEGLAADVAAGRKRLSVAAKCTALPANTSGASVDDGGACELTAAARQDYFTLRGQIAQTGKQLAGLQAYVNGVCRKSEANP